MPKVETIETFLVSIYHRNESGDSEKTSYVKLFFKVLRHPFIGFAAFRYLMSFPVVRVAIPDAERSCNRWLFDPRRPWRHNGFIVSFIEIPTPLSRYFQGTARQNLRTRTRQALAAGYRVRVLDSFEINDAISQVFKDKGWDADHQLMGLSYDGEPVAGAICVGVFDASGHVVGFSLGTQSGNVVRTLLSVISRKGSVRWLCFSGYVEEVSARGGRFILEAPPWAFTGRHSIFAGHLGFTPARIRRA